jgi:hypothetical protein
MMPAAAIDHGWSVTAGVCSSDQWVGKDRTGRVAFSVSTQRANFTAAFGR